MIPVVPWESPYEYSRVVVTSTMPGGRALRSPAIKYSSWDGEANPRPPIRPGPSDVALVRRLRGVGPQERLRSRERQRHGKVFGSNSEINRNSILGEGCRVQTVERKITGPSLKQCLQRRQWILYQAPRKLLLQPEAIYKQD